MRKILAATAVAAAAAGMFSTGTAQAETNPSCSRVTQIGSTAYVKNYERTVASVKQFKGCDKNWSYVYVWDSWLADHRGDFYLTAYIQTRPNLTHGYKTGARGQRELWSRGADTLDQCTRAVGIVDGDSYTLHASTDERC
jgi:hypothetical protein